MKTDRQTAFESATRLIRMRDMFDHEGGILVDDCEYFMRSRLAAQLDAPTLPSKVAHMSAAQHGKRSPELS